MPPMSSPRYCAHLAAQNGLRCTKAEGGLGEQRRLLARRSTHRKCAVVEPVHHEKTDEDRHYAVDACEGGVEPRRVREEQHGQPDANESSTQDGKGDPVERAFRRAPERAQDVVLKFEKQRVHDLARGKVADAAHERVAAQRLAHPVRVRAVEHDGGVRTSSLHEHVAAWVLSKESGGVVDYPVDGEPQLYRSEKRCERKASPNSPGSDSRRSEMRASATLHQRKPFLLPR